MKADFFFGLEDLKDILRCHIQGYLRPGLNKVSVSGISFVIDGEFAGDEVIESVTGISVSVCTDTPSDEAAKPLDSQELKDWLNSKTELTD